MDILMKLLRSYVLEVVNASVPVGNKLWVFDFDDTLVRTDALIHVTRADGSTFDLAPHELSMHRPQPGEAFDYADFRVLTNPRPIEWTNARLQEAYRRHGPTAVTVLSAREQATPIRQYLLGTGHAGIEVVALGDVNPAAKARWVDDRIRNAQLAAVEYFDDSRPNIAAIKALQTRHPRVLIVTHLVGPDD